MNAKERSNSVVVCRVGHEPEIVPVTRSFDYSHVKTLVKRADLPLSYPKYLEGGLPRGLSVCCDDSAALKRLPVNRWGIIGDFIVCRTFSASNRGLEQADAEKIVRHLTEEYGYLRSDSGVQNITHGGVGFWGRHVLAPHQLEQKGQEFDPDLHFTGVYNEPEATFINWLTSRFSPSIIAAHAYSPFPQCFSLELQFGTSDWDQLQYRECRRLYQSAYSRSGHLKPNIAERPPALRTRARLRSRSAATR